jgi:hypothetical protein
MWQNSNQKVRALANARKRDRERARMAVHFKRISATVEAVMEEGRAPSTIEARVILNDFSNKGVSFFSPTLLPQGLPITLTTHAPFGIVLHGKIAYCQEANISSHVISNVQFIYRIGIEFTPANDVEKDLITQYCKDIHKSFLITKAA